MDLATRSEEGMVTVAAAGSDGVVRWVARAQSGLGGRWGKGRGGICVCVGGGGDMEWVEQGGYCQVSTR